MSRLDEWTEALCAELGIDPPGDSQRTVLDLARIVAHAIDRPAAPVTAFLAGMAVGQGRPLGDIAAAVRRLVADWPAPPGDEPAGQ